MNKKIDLASLKKNADSNVFIVIGIVILVLLLGFASWLTISEGMNLETSIATKASDYNSKKALIQNLENLKVNSDYYNAQKAKYDEVIAEAGSYNSVDYYVELTELCDEYDLEISEITVGELQPGTSVQFATTELTVVGDEADVRQMSAYIVSQTELVRIDDIIMEQQEDGSVVAFIRIVKFTK